MNGSQNIQFLVLKPCICIRINALKVNVKHSLLLLRSVLPVLETFHCVFAPVNNSSQRDKPSKK